MVIMADSEFQKIYDAILAITQNGMVIDELGILDDEDWNNIGDALKICRREVLGK